MATRAEQIVKAAAAAVADYRRKQAAQAQTVWCIVPQETGMLDFSGQSQIASVPVFESEQDAQLELENFADSLEGYIVVQATITFKSDAESMGGVYDR